jgi:hypothetical protein
LGVVGESNGVKGVWNQQLTNIASAKPKRGIYTALNSDCPNYLSHHNVRVSTFTTASKSRHLPYQRLNKLSNSDDNQADSQQPYEPKPVLPGDCSSVIWMKESVDHDLRFEDHPCTEAGE